MLSKKSKYAIKALIALSKYNESGWPLRISQLSASERIPKKFLENILLQLKQHNILTSTRGINGGYLLSKKPHEIFLIDIFNITEGPIYFFPCGDKEDQQHCEDCPSQHTCSLKHLAQKAWEKQLEILGTTSIADLIALEKQHSGNKV